MQKALSLSYFGAQSRFANEIDAIVFDGQEYSRYIDLTSGGMGTPYYLCTTKKIPVTVNDISYYSYCCGKAVFTEKETPKVALFDTLNAVEPVEGLLFSKRFEKNINLRYGNWSDEIRKFVDGVVTAFSNDYFILAAIGKTLLNEGSFRGLTFCGTSPNKIKLGDYPLFTFQKKVVGHYENFRTLADTIEVTNCEACNMDASDLVFTYDKFKDAVVYFDPAWPFAASYADKTNPYAIVAHDIPEILKQQLLDPIEALWTLDKPQKIYDDVTHWITMALQKGAKRVVANTQSTNFPDPKDLETYLRTTFNVVKVVSSDQFSGMAKSKTFTEFWYVIE